MTRDMTLHKTSICGLRENNEDVEKYCMNLSMSGLPLRDDLAPIDLFIVCDGHGGKDVSEYVAQRLYDVFMDKMNIYPLSKQAIRVIYGNIQSELMNHPKDIGKTCGSTALMIIRYADITNNKKLQIVNLGDCRAVLSKKGTAVALTKDHKPDWPDEKMRINHIKQKYNLPEQISWDVDTWRIMDLSVSRAFGDIDQLPYVTHKPDVFEYQIVPDDEFVIMGCDGLWDVLKNEEAVNFVRDHRANNYISLYDMPGIYPPTNHIGQKNIARKLGDYAIARGSTDNVSVMIFFFERNKNTEK